MIDPEAAGFAPDIDRKLSSGIESGLLRGLHVVLASRSGKLGLERYYEGNDESWGRSLGNVTFRPDTLHDIRSVTKSIVGLLYGIALDRKLVPNTEAPLLPHFPEYPDLVADPERSRLTIEHALTMTLGMDWDEDRSYADPENSEIAMECAPDRYRYILERPIVAAPGERWIYSGGSVALVGAIIERGSRKTLPEFAQEVLFEPLGISRFEWLTGNDGVASPASGLRLAARDLLRIGELVVNNGEWRGKRIVSQQWIEESLRPFVPAGGGLHYGRLWYVCEGTSSELPINRRWVCAIGNGGQRLWLMPDIGLSAVALSGSYNAPDDWVTPTRVWREIILANIETA